MNRAIADNDLLAACEGVHRRVALYAFAACASIGCSWFIAAAYRAGALF
jgi:hypothetical protein